MPWLHVLVAVERYLSECMALVQVWNIRLLRQSVRRSLRLRDSDAGWSLATRQSQKHPSSDMQTHVLSVLHENGVPSLTSDRVLQLSPSARARSSRQWFRPQRRIDSDSSSITRI